MWRLEKPENRNGYAICLMENIQTFRKLNWEKFRVTGHVKNIQMYKVSRNLNLDVVSSVENNPHKTSDQKAEDGAISQRSVLCNLRDEQYHLYKIQLHQELIEDNPDDRMKDLCNRNPRFIKQIMSSGETTFCPNGCQSSKL